MEILERLKNKKIIFLGLGSENLALLVFLLKKKICCKITIGDSRGKDELGTRYREVEARATAFRLGGGEIKWRLGKNYDQGLSRFDVIFRVAGYPLFSDEIKRAGQAGVEISSAVKLFFEICPTKNIIGVTGTKGKGTTGSLIYWILKKAGRRVWLAGNVGKPVFEILPKIKPGDWAVLELSSFQLEDLDISPKIAVITNFYKEHLAPADPNNPNFHRSIGEYWRAKCNIIKYQNEGDFAVMNKKLEIIRQRREPDPPGADWAETRLGLGNKKLGRGKRIYFGKSELPSRLIGEHNKENIAGAVEAAKIAGVKKQDIERAVANFKGLEHRIEFVRNLNGVKYYNDSFATTPESAIIALKSFDAPIILIAGGADKGADFGRMALEAGKHCKACILLEGKGTDRLKRYLSFIIYHLSSFEFSDFKLAVQKARVIAEKGDVVLLSPGCASFGMFRNYKERGKLFKKYVKILK